MAAFVMDWVGDQRFACAGDGVLEARVGRLWTEARFRWGVYRWDGKLWREIARSDTAAPTMDYAKRQAEVWIQNNTQRREGTK